MVILLLITDLFTPMHAEALEISDETIDQAGGNGTFTRNYWDLKLKTINLGNYRIRLEAYERPYYVTIPIVNENYFKHSFKNYITEVDNTAPSARYGVRPITKIDIGYNNSKYGYNEAVDSALKQLTNELNKSSYGLDVKYNNVSSEEEYKIPYEYIENVATCHMGAGGNHEYIMGTYDNTSISTYDMVDHGLDYLQINTSFFIKRDDDGNKIYPNSNRGYKGCSVALVGAISEQMGYYTVEDNLPTHIEDIIVSKDGMTFKSINRTYPLQSIHVRVYSNIVGETDEGANGFGSIMNIGRTKIGYTTEYRSTYFSKGLSEMIWRPNSVRFAVYGNHDELRAYKGDRKQISENEFFNREIAILSENQLYYIGFGGPDNQDDFKNVIKYLKNLIINDNNCAIYLDGSSDVPNKVNTIVKEFILSKVPKYNEDQQWILVDQDITYNTTYDDSEKDPPLNLLEHDKEDREFLINSGISLTNNRYTSDKILAEKWRYKHKHTFYDNNNGVATFNTQWIKNPVTSFNKPGLYRINYKRRDNPFYPDMNLTNVFDNYRYWSKDYDYKLE